jgi:DNA replication protein
MKAYDLQREVLQNTLIEGIKEGTVAIPGLLLKQYRSLRLSELEVMLLIHLIAFLDKEKNDFPTIEELQSRMSAAPEAVIAGLQKLLKDGFITIDEEFEEGSGIQFERYNLTPLYKKLAESLIDRMSAKAQSKAAVDSGSAKDVYSIFEKEFARPLTPMELETISGWLDKDRYHDELILAALKEAVFAGKVHFRYVDRILLDWSRNRIATVEQAKEYAKRFRNSR